MVGSVPLAVLLLLLLLLKNGESALLPAVTRTTATVFQTLRSHGDTAAAPRATARSICVLESEAFPHIAEQLAGRLSLPLFGPNDLLHADPTLLLSHALSIEPYALEESVSDYTLGISAFDEPARGSSGKRRISMKPFYVDFCPPPTTRLGRRSAGDAGPDLLTKAVSPRKGFSSSGAVVFDLTAGLGQDALLMAKAGASRVHMVERDPIVAALLEDALRRLQLLTHSNDNATSAAAAALSTGLSLECGDGTQVLENLRRQSESDGSLRPDIIYLDPMFPARRKSALVKKNMQILHGLFSEPLDVAAEERHSLEEDALLRAALDAVKVRVVVKRPLHAPPLGCPGEQLRPAYQVLGSVNRWDVYVKH